MILVILSRDHEAGEQTPPRTWTVVRRNGAQWDFVDVCTAYHNYDMGSLHVYEDGTMRIVAPTAPGAHLWGCGGEVVQWVSSDLGATWTQEFQVTRDSERHHNYIRRPRFAHDEFYNFWTDGDPIERPPSYLYFSTKAGAVYRLPDSLEQETEMPELINEAVSLEPAQEIASYGRGGVNRQTTAPGRNRPTVLDLRGRECGNTCLTQGIYLEKYGKTGRVRIRWIEPGRQ